MLRAAVCTSFLAYENKEQRNTEVTINTCRLDEVWNERDARDQARNVPGLPDKEITRLRAVCKLVREQITSANLWRNTLVYNNKA